MLILVLMCFFLFFVVWGVGDVWLVLMLFHRCVSPPCVLSFVFVNGSCFVGLLCSCSFVVVCLVSCSCLVQLCARPHFAASVWLVVLLLCRLRFAVCFCVDVLI